MIENWNNDMGMDYLMSQKALEWANDLHDAAQDGFIDPLTAFTLFHRLKSCVELNMKAIQDQAVNEAAKYDGKTFNINGYEVTKKSGAGRWDFKHLSDWNEVKNNLSDIEEKHKTAFKMAEKGDTYITEGGEVVEPATYMPGADTISLKPTK